jgi:hypothetical protein
LITFVFVNSKLHILLNFALNLAEAVQLPAKINVSFVDILVYFSDLTFDIPAEIK